MCGEGGGGVRHSGVEWSTKLVHTEKLEHGDSEVRIAAPSRGSCSSSSNNTLAVHLPNLHLKG